MSNQDFVHGLHAVAAAIEAGEARQLWVLTERHDARLDGLLALAEQHGLPVQSKSRDQLDRHSSGGRHQGVLALLRPVALRPIEDLWPLLEKLAEPPLLLVLDGVQDPHNVGACLRSAEAAGVHALVIPKDRACPINATVRKVASGAASRLPIISVTNLARALAEMQAHGLWLTGLAGDANSSLYAADLRGPSAIVMGSEGEGMRRLTRERCDLLVHIPMRPPCESLNVSVAAGVAMYEAARQRQSSGG